MAEAQTWRIDTGDRVREVVVTSVHRGLWRCEDGPRETSPVAAVRAYAHFDGCGGMAVAPGEPTRAELAAQLAAVTAERDEMAARRDDALADYAAVNEYLGGIVRVWQRASDDERRMADTFVSRLRREIEEARDSGRGEWWEVCRGGNPAPLRTELAVLRAQQAPLVALFDEVMAAARAAGLRGAGHEPAEVVAAVRRGGAREGAEAVFAAALRTEGVEARERIRQVAALRGLGWLSVDADECGDEDSVCAAQSIAAKIRGREGGE